MTSRKFLLELFMPEARFPDEKFWTKGGDPIHPKPKGPPPGSRGRTHADFGARDADDFGQKIPGFEAIEIPSGWGQDDVDELVHRMESEGIDVKIHSGDVYVPEMYLFDVERIIDGMSQDEDVDAARKSADDGPMPSTWKLYGRAPGRTGNAGT